jgi:hypothetical protein
MQNQGSLILAEQHAIQDGIRRISGVEADGRQSEAIIERATVNIGDSGWNAHCHQFFAIVEGVIFDAECTVGNCNVCYPRALGKGFV